MDKIERDSMKSWFAVHRLLTVFERDRCSWRIKLVQYIFPHGLSNEVFVQYFLMVFLMSASLDL